MAYLVPWPGMYNMNLIMRKHHSVLHFGFIFLKSCGEIVQKGECQ